MLRSRTPHWWRGCRGGLPQAVVVLDKVPLTMRHTTAADSEAVLRLQACISPPLQVRYTV